LWISQPGTTDDELILTNTNSTATWIMMSGDNTADYGTISFLYFRFENANHYAAIPDRTTHDTGTRQVITTTNKQDANKWDIKDYGPV
jgi:hypothetical protein